MQIGDCFWGDPTGGDNMHPCLVLTNPDPQGRIAIVNFTSGIGGLKAQKVTPIDVPMLDYDSEVAWFDAGIYDNATCDQALAANLWETHERITLGKVKVIVNTGRLKGLLTREFLRYLGQQGMA